MDNPARTCVCNKCGLKAHTIADKDHRRCKAENLSDEDRENYAQGKVPYEDLIQPKTKKLPKNHRGTWQ